MLLSCSKGLFTRNVTVPVPVKVTIEVYPCVNGDRKFDGQNGPGTYFAYHHWYNVER